MKKIIVTIVSALLVVTLGITVYMEREKQLLKKESPQEIIKKYMSYIEEKKYDAMYSMIMTSDESSYSKEYFVDRNSRIYDGIEVKNLKIDNIKVHNNENGNVSVLYKTSFQTIAGEVNFRNSVTLVDTEDGYKILWNDNLIFPELEETDKVKVSTIQAERGEIKDRNGKMLAGKEIASTVGIVPGKLKNKEESLKKLEKILDIDVEMIKDKLEAKWVKDDSFVPITTIPKIDELDLMEMEFKEEVQKEQKRQKKLLNIPGIMLSDTEVRSYELGAAASHFIGYVQGVTAEDLEQHPEENYSSTSVIGRSGMEGLFEKKLNGKDGHRICIVDEDGNIKKTIASIEEQDGENIQLTIDSNLQKLLYEEFKKDKGCSVAINPYTGEVLALVSTPSYDNNDFIRGMSSKQWGALNDDKDKPLYNRFRQVWCPGSTFKPIIASVGLETGAFLENDDFGNEGLSWQKDSSWGSYFVTTLHEYEPVTMKNALIYSDNIYFAKAALKIGTNNLMKKLDEIGFNQNMPFEIRMSQSQYSNTDKIETEVQLADSGYGQGQILVNPLHLASIYTAFFNNGNIIKPYLTFQDDAKGETWIPNAFSSDTVHKVMEGLKGVINDSNGTARAAHREDITLAGKTGTAELKATKEDAEGTEIGWFAVFTVDRDVKKPILIVSMVENVKGIGGSGYVVNKDSAVLNQYLKEN